MGRWIKLSEAVPKQGLNVLICTPEGVWNFPEMLVVAYRFGEDWSDAHSGSPIPPPTHWMPLPTPPTEPTP